MIALRLGIRSVRRQGWRLLQVMAPAAMLFAMLAFVLATKDVVRDLAKKGVTERAFRLGSVDGINPDNAYYTRGEVNRLNSIPGIRAGGSNYWTCYVDDNAPMEFNCGSQSRVYLEARTYSLSEALLDDWDKVKNGAIIAGAIADKHHWKVGDHLTLKLGGVKSVLDVIVTGVDTKTNGTDSIVVHNDYFEAAAPEILPTYWVIWMLADKADQRAAFMDQIDADLNALHRPHTLWRAEDTISLVLGGGETLQQAFQFAGVLSLILVIALSATMLIVSIERRRTQFATLIAIGYRRAVLVRSVFVESIVIMFSSATIGASTMYLLFHDHPVRFAILMNVKVPLEVAVMTAIGGGVLSILTALLPAWRLHRIDVLASLR